MTTQITGFIKKYIGFLMVCLIATSCCTEETLKIKKIQELALYNKVSEPISTITDAFILKAQFSAYTPLKAGLSFDWILTTYNTCNNYNYSNQLIKDSVTITLDKDFIYKGKLITGGTSLMTIPELNHNNNLIIGQDYIVVNFTKDFLNNAQFKNKEYTLSLAVVTSDGLLFEKDTSFTNKL